MKSVASILLTLFVVSSLHAATPPTSYHLQMEANPAAPFPFFGKFGKVQLDVYTNGVRAESLWLHGFSRIDTDTVTIENPMSRISTDMPLDHIATTTAGMAKYKSDFGSPTFATPMHGRVGSLEATRFRLVYGPQAWIDIWTTTAVPTNLQYRKIVTEFIKGISPAAAAMSEKIPGNPIYVELNFRSYRKLPLLTLKSLVLDQTGEAGALSDGKLYVKTPLPDFVWK
jgi:hypothetical protein